MTNDAPNRLDAADFARKQKRVRFTPLKSKSDVPYCAKYYVPVSDCPFGDGGGEGGCPHDELNTGDEHER